MSQESHDTPARFGLDRNQYLETGQLTSQASEEESAPPPGLHRLVTGQLTEQDSQAEVCFSLVLFSLLNSNITPTVGAVLYVSLCL